MSTRNQLLGLWIALVGLLIVGAGVFIAGFFPPPAPDDPGHIVELYRNNAAQIRIGAVLLLIGSSMFNLIWVPIFLQLQRIEGSRSPLAYTQLALGIIGMWVFYIPGILFLAAAFRPDRSADAILALNDLAFIPLIGMWMIATVQFIVIGYAILQDGTGRVFPRWFGYFVIWVGLSFIGAALVPVVRHGPFAWNGLIGFWFEAAITAVWLVVTVVMLRRAILGEEAELEQAKGNLAAA